MSNLNEQLGAVQRAVLSTSFTTPGGKLTPKMQQAFFEYFRDVRLPLLGQARRHVMTQLTEDIDKIYLAEPITEAAPESNGLPAHDNGYNGAAFDQGVLAGGTVRMTAKKMRSSWQMSNDTKWSTLEQDRLMAHIMDMMVRRFALDLEIAAVQGDENAGTGSPLAKVRSINDGWGKLTDNAHIVSAGGYEPSYDLFHQAWHKIPDHRQGDPDLKWIWNPAVKMKLAQYLMTRRDAIGTAAAQGIVEGPLGIPYLEVSSVPKDQTITAMAVATPAEARSTRIGPFLVTASVKNLKLRLDAVAADVTVDLSTLLENGVSQGPVHARQVAKAINDALVADVNYGVAYKNVAKDDGTGRVLITGLVSGATGLIEFSHTAAPANDATALIGFSTGNTAYVGKAAASGTRKTGTFIWLANPANFLYGVLEGTRIHSRFMEESDVNRFVMYNWADFQVEELDYVVKIKDVLL